jgi:predicted XRE-type DNA-binding protein
MMEAYFTVESFSRTSEVTFHTLRSRLVAAVNARVQNGEFTERGLARILGVSQPHIHNVLKGARKLQWDLADRLIADLGIKLLDLLTDDELAGDKGVQRLSTRTPMLTYTRRDDPGAHMVPRKQPGQELRAKRTEQANRSAAV